MPKQIHIFRLSSAGAIEPQAVEMPRRARITGITFKSGAVQVFAEVEHDADTRAFDTNKHRRAFVVIVGASGRDVPTEGQLVGFDAGVHVYEVKAS